MAGDVICGLGLGTYHASYARYVSLTRVAGIQVCMFSYCVNYLWKTRHTRKQSMFMLAYVSVVFLVEVVFVAVQARTVQICYIDNRVSARFGVKRNSPSHTVRS